MQIVLVRHGQSTNNHLYETSVRVEDIGAPTERRWHRGRVPDPPLTDLGVRQAEALGAALCVGRAPFAPTHLYASLTARAVQTARPLAEATGLPVVLRADAYEVGGIHYYDPDARVRRARPGATLRDLQRHCPAAVPEPGIFGDPDAPWDGGLEQDDACALPRARGLLDSLRAAHGPDDVAVVVSHQYFSQFVIAALFGFGGPPWRRFRVDNTAHLAILVDGGRTSVEWVNRCDHLDPADMTN